MNKSRTPQIFFILAALTLAAGTGATIFQWQEIGDKWDTLAELKKNVRDPEDIQSEFDDTTTKVVSSKSELDHLERGIPAFAYVPTMLKEVEAYGTKHGIEVLGIRPIPRPETKDKTGRKKKAPYEEIAIEVKGRGSFKAVQAFISALEKFPKIVSARAISLQPKEVSGQAPGMRTLDVTLELRAFLFAPQEGEARTAAPAPADRVQMTSEAPNAKPEGESNPPKKPVAEPKAALTDKPKVAVKAVQSRVAMNSKANRKATQRSARR